jgi:hypothetical protein
MKNVISRSRLALVAAAIAILGVSSAFAGGSVPGIEVSVANAAGRVAAVVTDSSGTFSFRNLPPGEYTLTVSQSSANRAFATGQPQQQSRAAADFYLKLQRAGAQIAPVGIKHAFVGVKVVVGADGILIGIVSPRDAASGLPTGK